MYLKATKYVIVCENDLLKLEKDVQARIDYGWQPHGSLVVECRSDGSSLYIQPMVEKAHL
jgi:hypothetical protein